MEFGTLKLGLDYLALVIKTVSLLILLWGVGVGLIEFLKLEWKQIQGENICDRRESLRHHFGSYLLLAFEVLIAADLIVTLWYPTIEEISMLGLTVLIRTVLNYFLNKELASDAHSCRVTGN